MAHELATRADGQKAVFINGLPAWHKFGEPLQDATSIDEAIVAAGQDFHVDIVPSYQRVVITGADGSEQDEFYRKVEGTNYTVRTDTNAVLGSVGDSYTVAQNADTARILEPLLDSGLAVLESGGTLRGGQDVWLQVRFNLEDSEVKEYQAKHGLLPYGLWSNNHAGDRVQSLQTTRVRVVCANTLRAAHMDSRGENIGIRHTSGIKAATIAAAKELWGKIGVNEQKAMKHFQIMEQTILTDAQFTTLVLDEALPLPEKTPDTPRGETMLAQRIEARERVRTLWTGGFGHDGTPTAYNAYNGLVQAIDHEPKVFKVQGGDAARLGQLLYGNLGAIKTKVATNLVKLAGAK